MEHLAIWAGDLEALKEFYVTHFGLQASEKYHNPRKNFSSYFLAFPGGGSRLELMQMPGITHLQETANSFYGLAHFAISVGDRQAVDRKTEELRRLGITIAGEPRQTGDGYYESIVLDPEGNHVELVAAPD